MHPIDVKLPEAKSAPDVQTAAGELPVCAVVLNYECAAETIACVEALRQSDYSRLRIVVVDNGSSDRSLEELQEALPGIEVLCSGRNLGYGDGNNMGIRRGLAGGADLIWILTPDVRVEPGSLRLLAELMMRDRRIGICGPVVHTGNRCIAASRVVRRLGYLPKHEYRRESEAAGLPDVIATDYVDGCAIMVRREVIERIGLFRDDFFLYFDDTEYCLRARHSGWRIVLCGRSHVHTRPMQEDRNNRAFYMIRNSILLARVERRHVGVTVLRHVARALLHVCRLRRRSTPGFAAVTWRGVKAGLLRPLGTPPGV